MENRILTYMFPPMFGEPSMKVYIRRDIANQRNPIANYKKTRSTVANYKRARD